MLERHAKRRLVVPAREPRPRSTIDVRESRPKVLFICGSINQTTQMQAIARELSDCIARFTPYYVDGLYEAMRHLGLIEMSIGGNKRRGWCLEYLRDHSLPIDLHGQEGGYDLVVDCSDVIVPRNISNVPMVLVQEGILDPPGPLASLCKRFRFLPRPLAGTSLTGQSGRFERFCVASAGYRDFFVSEGVASSRLVVTGIPNFDDCRRYLVNDFPHHGYVLVCTSDARETFKRDDRAALVKRALEIARGRLVVFKLHPNEDHARATVEILALAPKALVYASGSAEEMIANADVVVTQWSSTAFVALALGKELHSNFPLAELRRLAPVQNGGRSARNIAQVCREVLASVGPIPREVQATAPWVASRPAYA
jgi:hypothetical protein